MNRIKNIWWAYDESTWPLRFKVIRKALTIKGERENEDLNFMLDDRFFEYSCRIAEYRGKREAYMHIKVVLSDKNHPVTLEQARRQVQALDSGIDEGLAMLKDRYLKGERYL